MKANPDSKSVLVLGGGLGGLAAAALWSRQGYQVKVLEKNNWWGGKCRRLRFEDGSYIDSGPSIFTFPSVWQEYFAYWKALAPEKKTDIAPLKLKPFSGVGLYSFQDECISTEDLPESLNSAWQVYLDKHKAASEDLLRLTTTDPQSPTSIGPALKLLKSTGLKSNMESYLKSLDLPVQLDEIIRIHALNTGAGPQRIPAFFASLAAGLSHTGVLYPEGGLYELVNQLVAMNEEQGCQLILDAAIHRIDETGVETSKGRFEADILINSLDIDIFQKLCTKKPSKTGEGPLTSAAIAIYGRLDQTPEKASKICDEHVVLMPEDQESFYRDLIVGKQPESTMSFFSLHPEKSRVYPQNQSPVFSLIITVPPSGDGFSLDSGIVQKEFDRLRDRFDIELGDYIQECQILDPEYYQSFGAEGGAIYGRSLSFKESGPFHPISYQDPDWKHLWQVGTNVHPGGGIPAILGGVLIAHRKMHSNRKGLGLGSMLKPNRLRSLGRGLGLDL